MSSEWPIWQIQDVCSVGDGAHSKVQRTGAGVLYLTSKNIGQGNLKLDKYDFISVESFNKLFPLESKATRRPRPGDLLIGIIGTFGNAYLYKESDSFGFSSSIGIIRPNKEKILPRYLYYVVTSPKFKSVHIASDGGSAQGYTNIPAIKKLPIYVPPLQAQDAIASLLGALDDRIDLLRETNATLEAIAQALFKSWFVDFDPVRAKMVGRVPDGMDEATAALFSDGLEESELGEVPRGWQPKRLDDFIDLAYGKALKAGDRESGGVPVYGSGGMTGWHNVALVNAPSIVVGRKGTVGSLYWESRPFFPIDTVFYVKSKLPLTYCYYLLQTLGLKDMNTDAAVPGLNRENVYRLKVPACPETLLAAFDAIVAPLRASIDHSNQQIGMLTSIRDTLLPRLISGLLRLPDVENQIEAIAA